MRSRSSWSKAGLALTWFTAAATGQEAPAAKEAPPAAPGSASAKSRMEYFTHESKTLGTSLNVGVYLPAGYDGGKERYPVVYFLHGLWGDCRKWESRGTPKTLDALIEDNKVPPMIVVTPDGQNSMYVNALESKTPWGDFVAGELVTLIDGKYRTVAKREMRGVNGDSMGGYGALNAAFKHPDVFGSVTSHSAAIYPIDPEKLPDFIKQRVGPMFKPVYGWPVDVPHWKEWNPLEVAATVPVEQLTKLAIYFDCGDKDRYGFDQTNAELHDLLEKRKVPHEWHLRDGGHGRDYFADHVGESMQFHGHVFDSAADGKPAAAPPPSKQ